MTKEEMKAQIEATAKAARKAGGFVECLKSHGTVAFAFEAADEYVVTPAFHAGEYHFSYSEADDLREEAVKAAEEFGVDPEDYVLWKAQGW